MLLCRRPVQMRRTSNRRGHLAGLPSEERGVDGSAIAPQRIHIGSRIRTIVTRCVPICPGPTEIMVSGRSNQAITVT
jgi:hypothetical protein